MNHGYFVVLNMSYNDEASVLFVAETIYVSNILFVSEKYVL